MINVFLLSGPEKKKGMGTWVDFQMDASLEVDVLGLNIHTEPCSSLDHGCTVQMLFADFYLARINI